MKRNRQTRGFTLIELSIVLVIIGLMVGGVLVGQNLIRAAAVQATITQVNKFNTAANTFFEKYRYLPGDIPAGPASQFGFAARGPYVGQGDGDGLIQGNWNNNYFGGQPYVYEAGETVMFWQDLSQAGLIEENFSAASSTLPAGTITSGTTPNIDAFFPQAKLGHGTYIYVTGIAPMYGGGQTLQNYFGIAGITTIGNVEGCDGCLGTTPVVTVMEAYSIDNKLDDGFAQQGRIIAAWLDPYPAYANAAASHSPTTCQNYSDIYSITINNGAGLNCALMFRMQAGD
jgi:prepilin-type N-terminal cleavage/methylation domain-containing protein